MLLLAPNETNETTLPRSYVRPLYLYCVYQSSIVLLCASSHARKKRIIHTCTTCVVLQCQSSPLHHLTSPPSVYEHILIVSHIFAEMLGTRRDPYKKMWFFWHIWVNNSPWSHSLSHLLYEYEKRAKETSASSRLDKMNISPNCSWKSLRRTYPSSNWSTHLLSCFLSFIYCLLFFHNTIHPSIIHPFICLHFSACQSLLLTLCFF